MSSKYQSPKYLISIFFLADLVCPNSGSDIVIDGIGMESQKFRFPAVGTIGFPK